MEHLESSQSRTSETKTEQENGTVYNESTYVTANYNTDFFYKDESFIDTVMATQDDYNKVMDCDSANGILGATIFNYDVQLPAISGGGHFKPQKFAIVFKRKKDSA